MSEELNGKLKAVGLEIAESHLIQAVDDVFLLAEVVVADTTTPLDDTFLALFQTFKATLKEFADKVNPED